MRVSDYYNITHKTLELCKQKALSNSGYWQESYRFLLEMLERDYKGITKRQENWLRNIKDSLETDDQYPGKRAYRQISWDEFESMKEGNRKRSRKELDSGGKLTPTSEDDKAKPTQKSLFGIKDDFLKQTKYVHWEPEVAPEAIQTPIQSFVPKPRKKPQEQGSSIRRDEIPRPDIESDPMTYRNTQEILDAIGEWGEKKFFVSLTRYLQTKYKGCEFQRSEHDFKVLQGKNILAELRWLNRRDRVQEGYDLTLEENGAMKYIEVKSTILDEIDVVELSGKQWEFLKSKGEDYVIYRVFRAGYADSWIEEIQNPFKALLEGKLGVDAIRLKL